MSFLEWLYSSYPNPSIQGQWGPLHICTLLLCIAIIVALALIFRNKSEKSRKIVVYVLVGLILLFEVARRIINLCKTEDYSLHNLLVILLPRPWCAISCWALMISVLVKKDWFYNFASTSALLCSLTFFAYPGVGFNNEYILFENLYSICTHSLLLVSSITLITLKFTHFDVKTLWQTLLCYAVVFFYAFLEIFALGIEDDPLYFMPNSDVQEILGLPYGAYVVVYALFIALYLFGFYLCSHLRRKKLNRNLPTQKSA